MEGNLVAAKANRPGSIDDQQLTEEQEKARMSLTATYKILLKMRAESIIRLEQFLKGVDVYLKAGIIPSVRRASGKTWLEDIQQCMDEAEEAVSAAKANKAYPEELPLTNENQTKEITGRLTQGREKQRLSSAVAKCSVIWRELHVAMHKESDFVKA